MHIISDTSATVLRPLQSYVETSEWNASWAIEETVLRANFFCFDRRRWDRENTFELLSIQNLFNGFHCINQYADIVCDEMWKQSRQRNISQKLNTISREYNRVWLKKKKSSSRLLCTLHNTLRYFSNFTKRIYQTHINFRLLFHTSAKKIHVKTSTRWNHGVNILL